MAKLKAPKNLNEKMAMDQLKDLMKQGFNPNLKTAKSKQGRISDTPLFSAPSNPNLF